MAKRKSLNNKGGTVFVTSDTHFYHKFLAFHRGYEDEVNMTNHMIDVWNSVVGENDTVVVIGDFSFGSVTQTEQLLEDLNGDIILVAGNHDEMMKKRITRFNISIYDYLEVYSKGNDPDAEAVKVCMFHFPIISWNRMHQGAIHLHGHCHGGLFPIHSNRRSMDVGWDVLHKPVPLKDLVDRLKDQEFEQTDGHHIEKGSIKMGWVRRLALWLWEKGK